MSKRVREVNRANVAASTRRLSRETAVVADKRRRVKKADDLEWIMAELKAHPERRGALRAQLEASVEPKYDSRVQFNTENARKTIVKVPPKFLNEQFLVRFEFAVEALKALFEKDRMAPSKNLMRAATITKSCPFGPLFNAQWISWMQRRVDLFCFSHTAI